jgi:hypothetical protein
VSETDDPDEIVGYLLYLMRHPDEQERIRVGGKETAKQFLWDRVIENLVGKLEFLARKQNIVLPSNQGLNGASKPSAKVAEQNVMAQTASASTKSRSRYPQSGS